MNPDKILLPDFVIANLFTDQLVIGAAVQLKQVNPETPVDAVLHTIVPTVNSASEKPIAKPVNLTKTTATEPINISPEKQWYLGNNGKHITIIIREAGVLYINDKHLQFLSNILNACKLNLGDIALINHANASFSYSELKQKLGSQFLLTFDLEPKDLKLPFTIPNYQVQSHDNCKFLFASSLVKMDADSLEAKTEKSKLWMSLKNMFQLK